MEDVEELDGVPVPVDPPVLGTDISERLSQSVRGCSPVKLSSSVKRDRTRPSVASFRGGVVMRRASYGLLAMISVGINCTSARQSRRYVHLQGKRCPRRCG